MNNKNKDTNEVDSRQANTLELFLDLVFVLSIVQITTTMSSNLTFNGLLKGVMLTWIIWWLWTAFTWAGAAVDFQSSTKHRVFILFMIPMMVIMAVTVPFAFSDLGIWFAISVFVVQVWITLLQGLDAWIDPLRRKAWLSYGPFALVAPFVLVIGAMFDGNTRISIWCVAITINILSALFGGRTSQNSWKIDAVQFTERHSLFIILSLGEIFIAVGLKATSVLEKNPFDFGTAAAIIAAASIACVYWWTYFAYIPEVLEHKLASVDKSQKGRIARDLFSFGHFPIVVSILLFAIVAKHLVEHPFHILENTDLILLGVSVFLLIGSIMHFQWRIARSLSMIRLATILVAILICYAGQFLNGISTISLLSLLIGISSTGVWFRVNKTKATIAQT